MSGKHILSSLIFRLRFYELISYHPRFSCFHVFYLKSYITDGSIIFIAVCLNFVISFPLLYYLSPFVTLFLCHHQIYLWPSLLSIYMYQYSQNGSLYFLLLILILIFFLEFFILLTFCSILLLASFIYNSNCFAVVSTFLNIPSNSFLLLAVSAMSSAKAMTYCFL